MAPILLSPKSSGSIKLADSNPSSYPVVKANFLDNKQDLQVLAYGSKRCYEIAKATAFSSVIKDWICPPKIENVEEKTIEFWENYVIQRVQSATHQVCKFL